MQSSAQSSPTQKCASSGSEDLNFADDPDFVSFTLHFYLILFGAVLKGLYSPKIHCNFRVA